MNSIEQRVDALEAELAEVKRQLRGGRRGVIGRTQPDFLDTTFGIHAKSVAFPEVMREIEAEREREREEARRLLAEDEAA